MKLFLDIPAREEEEEEEGDEDDNKTENISDEGIEDAGSDSGATPNDYLMSSVSKADLYLLSMLFIYYILFPYISLNPTYMFCVLYVAFVCNVCIVVCCACFFFHFIHTLLLCYEVL